MSPCGWGGGAGKSALFRQKQSLGVGCELSAPTVAGG